MEDLKGIAEALQLDSESKGNSNSYSLKASEIAAFREVVAKLPRVVPLSLWRQVHED